jgi:pimeloyl-ACP methyl ester carboxylesterase
MRATWGTAALAALIVVTAGPGVAEARDYAPVDAPGPALSVPVAKLDASVVCSADVATAERPPVLLTPATTVTSRENFGWNWVPALRARGFPVCTSDQVDDPQNMGDMQERAEYVVHAIRRVHALSGGRRIAIVGHSQGGMIMRWALRFWPDVRPMVQDVVGMAATNHGSVVVPALCVPACAPALWQQRADSAWTAALNSRQETFAGIDYTSIYTRTDQFVQPNLDDGGTTSLRPGPGRITNVALQDVCPASVTDHLFIGTTDSVAWALGVDALTHDGPADPSRVDPGVCAQQSMPGVDPVTGPGAVAETVSRLIEQLALAPRSASEPALRCYVTATCPAPAQAPATCVSRRTVTVTVPRGLRAVRVRRDGRTVPTRVRRGRRVAVIDMRGLGPRTVTVRISGRTRSGRATTVTRRFRTCGAARAGSRVGGRA